MAKAELLVSFLLCISAVYAADHVVGGKNGWQEILIDYTQWAAGENFVAGDTLTFNYEPIHNVVEVDKDGYDTCVVPGNIPSYTGGHTTINLTLPGSRYFICSISDHCPAGGMKLAITVEGGSSGGSTPPSPSPASTPPSDIPPAPTPPGTPPSDTTPSPSPALVPPSDTPSPSPSSNPPSDLLPPTPSPSLLPPSDLPPTPPLATPPPPSAGTFATLNPLLIGLSLILVSLVAFIG